jgi:EpsI family protein
MIARSFVLAAALLAGGIGREALDRRAIFDAPPVSLARIAPSFDTWRSLGDQRYPASIERALATDAYLNRSYRENTGRIADLYVGYYRAQRQGAAIHSPLNCLPGAGWEPVLRERVALGDRADAVVNRVVVQKGEQQQLVYYWYQSQDRIIASDYVSKFYLVADAITKHRSDAALVRVIVALPSNWPDASADRSARTLADGVSRSVAQLFRQ